MLLLRPSIWLLGGILAFGGLLQAGGCATLTAPEAPPRTTPVVPLWSDEAMQEHLRFFNGSEVGGRATGTAGYSTAAAYVAARMDEFGLRPALRREARVVYSMPLHEVRAASVAALGADTLALLPGADFLPDGRSDAGRLEVRALLIDPALAPDDGPLEVPPTTAVLLPAATATTAYLRRLRQAGARAVFVVGTLVPRPAPRPVRGLLVIQVPPPTAVRLLRATRADLAALLRAGERVTRTLPRPVRLEVEAVTWPAAGAVNVLGFTPGKHPGWAGELVIVCADLDAIGPFAGVPTLDTDHLGVETAALLEVARQYASFARYGSVPDRSILFAVFSGGRQGQAGLRNYVHHPLWALDHTRAVIFLGLDPSDEPAVRALLAEKGVPLYVVSPPDTLGTPGVVLLPRQRPPRQRTLRTPDEEAYRDDPPRLDALIEIGVGQARRMAEATHALLARETIVPAPRYFVPQDTLR